MIEYNFKIDEKLQDLIDTCLTDEDRQNTYGILVNKFIRQYYNEDRVEAIINNKLAEPNVKHSKEFDDLQAFRKQCKQEAKRLLGLEE